MTTTDPTTNGHGARPLLERPDSGLITWKHVQAGARAIAHQYEHAELVSVYGIPRGGCTIAALVAEHLDLPLLEQHPDASPVDPTRVLIVDDLIDTGATIDRFPPDLYPWRAVLVSKGATRPGLTHVYDCPQDVWAVFPWEATEAPAADNVVRLLEAIGEDPTRSGLLDTPDRVVRALTEMTAGRHVDVPALLSRTFDEPTTDLVAVYGMEFSSLCEHHLLPFTGHASIAYAPTGHRVVGLSKLARLVDAYAHRLQVQERMTEQIAEALHTADPLNPSGVMVAVTAQHSCMACRGVRRLAHMETVGHRGDLAPELAASFLAGHRQRTP
jgi:GTP cyclohydrolase I